MKLTTLKPRLSAQGSRMGTLTARPDATPRMRGRKWMDRRERWLSAHPLCEHCQAEDRVTHAQEVDHVIALWAGGKDDESNYSSLCVEHHKAKTAQEAKHRANGAPAGPW